MKIVSRVLDIILIVTISILLCAIINNIVERLSEKSELTDDKTVSSYSDIKAITQETLLSELTVNLYNVKVSFEDLQRVDGVVQSVSITGKYITVGSKYKPLRLDVSRVFRSNDQYTYIVDGKEVSVKKSDILKKYMCQLRKGDPISLIGYDLIEDDDGYIVLISDFDIADLIVDTESKDNIALLQKLGLLDKN